MFGFRAGILPRKLIRASVCNSLLSDRVASFFFPHPFVCLILTIPPRTQRLIPRHAGPPRTQRLSPRHATHYTTRTHTHTRMQLPAELTLSRRRREDRLPELTAETEGKV